MRTTCSRSTTRTARYPLCYITEAGWWTLNEHEAAAFRAYLLKGGFVIFDDFKVPGEFGPGGGGWDTFEQNMQRVFPAAKFVRWTPRIRSSIRSSRSTR